jgi:hypothetical protein
MPVMKLNDYSTENLPAVLRRFDDHPTTQKAKPKKTFYCVMIEVYANGTVLAGIKTRNCREKPQNTEQKNPIVHGYNHWFDTMAEAETCVKAAKKEGAAA